MPGLKEYYLNLLDKKEKNFPEAALSFFLILLSYIYALAVGLRNFLFDKGILFSGISRAKVISLGNLSWSGSGKTSLTLWLYEKLSGQYKIAVLRRPYASDEEKLLSSKVKSVFSFKDRYKTARAQENRFNLFLLDDGFQYRRLRRDLDIVLIGAREFKIKHRLIPAGIFREPLASLGRAKIIIVNYKNELENPARAKREITKYAPGAKIFFAKYRIDGFHDFSGRRPEAAFLKKERLAAFCAIGYPRGFLNLLKGYGLEIDREFIFSDHHELSLEEYRRIEDCLLARKIGTIIITAKDRCHIPKVKSRLNILIAEVIMEIDNQQEFLDEIKLCIK